ncbi:MAG: NAD(P)-dependent glycerol-3-phosphate dehydrogenase [Gammaproteobacteria bacterium]|nr:NAD(P)-dependent glycerol-3-phosphate dehydrogenase [Gammaproteobacteria bacterium]
MKITMIGGGAWGSAVGSVLERNNHQLNYLKRVDKTWIDDDHGQMIFLAVPCQVLRSRLESLSTPSPEVPVVSLIKGIEVENFDRVSSIVKSVWPDSPFATISGPSFAHEVSMSMPTAAVVAAESIELAQGVQTIANDKTFRLYTSQDLVGVELGGALKNVYAIAGGMCQGLGMGDNAMAGLMTRSLAEMSRIALSLGARQETLFGLSGIGDLMLTSFSGASRNHQVGEALGKGGEIKTIMENLRGTAEGVPTARAIHDWVVKQEIKAPIISEVYAVLYENKSPRKSVEDLLLREVGQE